MLKSPQFQVYSSSFNCRPTQVPLIFRHTQVLSISGIIKFSSFQAYPSSLNFRRTQFPSISAYSISPSFRHTQVSSISGVLMFSQFHTYSSFLSVVVLKFPQFQAYENLNNLANKQTTLLKRQIFRAVMKAKLEEGGGRALLGDNTCGEAVILVCIRLKRVAVWISTGLLAN